MPTYEYECDACGHAFEELQSITAPAIRKCPKCRKLRVRRIISGGAGLIFKGSGFYETDYKRPRRGGAKPSSGESETAAPAKEPAKDAPAWPHSARDMVARCDVVAAGPRQTRPSSARISTTMSTVPSAPLG